jgi:hypothetical protein
MTETELGEFTRSSLAQYGASLSELAGLPLLLFDHDAVDDEPNRRYQSRRDRRQSGGASLIACDPARSRAVSNARGRGAVNAHFNFLKDLGRVAYLFTSLRHLYIYVARYPTNTQRLIFPLH